MLPLAMAYSDLLADGVAIVIPAFVFIAAAAAGIVYFGWQAAVLIAVSLDMKKYVVKK